MEYLTLFLYSWFISGCLSSLVFTLCCIYIDCKFESQDFFVSIFLVIFGYVSLILIIEILFETVKETKE